MSGTLFMIVYLVPAVLLFFIALQVEKKTGKSIYDKLMFWPSMGLFASAIVLAHAGADISVVRSITFIGIGYLAVAGVARVFITIQDPKLRKRENEDD